MDQHALFAVVAAVVFLPVLGCALGWLGAADGAAPAAVGPDPGGAAANSAPPVPGR
jgi:hypothetical protein